MLYFAYGSNLSFQRIFHRTPSARFIEVAKLFNHELVFHKASIDGSGKCDVIETSNEDSYAIGVVYEISSQDKPKLDYYEELGVGYKEKSITVTSNKGNPLSVFLYYAIQIDTSRQPYHWYKEHVLRGAKEHQFDIDYIKQIEAIRSIDDPDSERQKRELAIYEQL